MDKEDNERRDDGGADQPKSVDQAPPLSETKEKDTRTGPLKLRPEMEQKVKLPGLDGLKTFLSHHAPNPRSIVEGSIAGLVSAVLVMWLLPQPAQGTPDPIIQTPHICQTAPSVVASLSE